MFASLKVSWLMEDLQCTMLCIIYSSILYTEQSNEQCPYCAVEMLEKDLKWKFIRIHPQRRLDHHTDMFKVLEWLKTGKNIDVFMQMF